MNSQDGNRVYLKPGGVEKIPTGDLRAIWVFFRNNMYQIFIFLFFTIIWSNEPRPDIWSIPCQSAVVGSHFAFSVLGFLINQTECVCQRISNRIEDAVLPSQVFLSNWSAQVGTRTGLNTLEHFWRYNRSRWVAELSKRGRVCVCVCVWKVPGKCLDWRCCENAVRVLSTISRNSAGLEMCCHTRRRR